MRSSLDLTERLENDVCFILTNLFLIFSMQTGYGLLESGIVSRKNEVNILLKNAVNIISGSLSFWAFGFAFSWNTADKTYVNESISEMIFNKTSLRANSIKMNSFVRQHIISWDLLFASDPMTDGSGEASNSDEIDTTYVEMSFQLAYATMCTAIISSAMAERCRFGPFVLFSLASTLLFCLPARWTTFGGWLGRRGVIDIGGSGTVHLVGGSAGLVVAIVLGPRLGRFETTLMERNGRMGRVPLGNPSNALHGLNILWWGWLGYTAGSLFGINNDKWEFSARASVVTIIASTSGGMFGMVWSAVTRSGLQDVRVLLDSLLASLVAISGGSPIILPAYSIVVGVCGTLLTLLAIPLLERMRVDDPINAFAVHAVAGAWSFFATGIFADHESIVHLYNYRQTKHRTEETFITSNTLTFRQSLILSQLFAIVVLVLWSVVVTLLLLLPIHFTIGLRVSPEEELLGQDYVEHGLEHDGNWHLVHVIRQKVALVSGGMNDIQASAKVTANLYPSKVLASKKSLTPITSPWTDSRLRPVAKSILAISPDPVHVHATTSNSAHDRPSTYSYNHGKPRNIQPIWSTESDSTKLTKYTHQSSHSFTMPPIEQA